MANNFHILTVPPSDGVGAGVDISDIAPGRTFCVDNGDFSGTLFIQASQDNVNFLDVPGAAFTSGAQLILRVIASFKFARVRRVGVTVPSGSPVVAVGGPAAGAATLFGTLAVPAGDGVGAATDISAAGDVLTAMVNLNDVGILTIEGSEDGGATFSPVMVFGTPIQPPFQTAVTATFSRLRVRRAQTPGGAALPVIGFGSMTEFNPPAVPPETLSQAYNAGVLTADQTMLLLTAKGGGLVLDARDNGFIDPGFLAPAAIQILGIVQGNFRVDKLGRVAIGQDTAHLDGRKGFIICETPVNPCSWGLESRNGTLAVDTWSAEPRKGFSRLRMGWNIGISGNVSSEFPVEFWASATVHDASAIGNPNPGVVTPYSLALGGAVLPNGKAGAQNDNPKGALAATGGSAVPVSVANTGLIAFDEVDEIWKRSENTGAWIPIGAGTAAKTLADAPAIVGTDLSKNDTFKITVAAAGHVLSAATNPIFDMQAWRLRIKKTNAGDDFTFGAGYRFANAASTGPKLADFIALVAAAPAGGEVRVNLEWNADDAVNDIVGFQGYWP